MSDNAILGALRRMGIGKQEMRRSWFSGHGENYLGSSVGLSSRLY